MGTGKARSFLLRGCTVCGGDAYLDLSEEPEWRCLLCGRSVSPAVARRRRAATQASRRKAA